FAVQFSTPLDKKVIDNLEEVVFSSRPDILLRAYGHYSEECDLQFLERMPSLRKFSADCLMNVKGIESIIKIQNIEVLGVGVFELDNFDFLDKINPTLKELYLYQTRSKKPKIDSISRFQNLEYIYLEGQSKGIKEIQKLKELKKIVLRSISTDNLDYLAEKNHLWSVDIKLGGIQNFDALKSLPNLKYLELWQIRDLADLSFISSLVTLQYLYIQSLRNVEKIPPLDKLKRLRRIYFENLKGLNNLSSLRHVENLKEFIYVLAQNQEPENLQPVLDNPSVQTVLCKFGSDKKNKTFDNLAIKAGKEQYKFSEFKFE
ncbi:MAG: hypothetical protein HOP30_21075, partial [Cyclobacteriaceae bacterium]|nr:hypothetical protein [Cyclobacteriaceae bacterium]